ncbi:site-specific integrase [Kitasatospora cineracea]|uniref:site-specific integrase n=1 Tax=Kitasatospora cineracea TaxID=88074 RepID=UPI00369BA8B2
MADVPTAAAPSLEALDSLVERTCEPPTGPSRAKQLRWIAGELRTALERGAIPPQAADSLNALLAPATLAAYLGAAEQGLLRRKPAARPDQPSPASMRVREDCLRILGAEAGLTLALPERERPAVALRPVITARPRSILLGHLESATRPGRDDARTRILAIIGTVLDTGCRAGELCALRTADVDLRRGTIRLTRLPQHSDPHVPPATETVALSPTTRAALRHWLTTRARLTLRDTTRPPAPATRPPTPCGSASPPAATPAPAPLRVRGLARAYARAIHDLNTDMAGQPVWHPLPRRTRTPTPRPA